MGREVDFDVIFSHSLYPVLIISQLTSPLLDYDRCSFLVPLPRRPSLLYRVQPQKLVPKIYRLKKRSREDEKGRKCYIMYI